MRDRFSEAGATLLAVSPQLADRSRSLIEKRRLGFEILRDPGNEVAAAFGLRFKLPDDLRALYQQLGLDLAACNGEASWTLPLPARFLIDQQGAVRHARTDPDYTRRPEAEETLAAVAELSA